MRCEVEKPMLLGKIDELYRVIKHNLGVNNLRTSSVLNREGNQVYKTVYEINRRVEYIEGLSNGNGSENDLIWNEDTVDKNDKGVIMRSEFDWALIDLNNN